MEKNKRTQTTRKGRKKATNNSIPFFSGIFFAGPDHHSEEDACKFALTFPNNTLLINENASWFRLLEAISSVSEDSVCIIFISGHACRDPNDGFCLCACDGELIPLITIRRSVLMMNCTRVLLCLDCCNAGAFLKPISPNQKVRSRKTDARVFLVSSGREEKSYSRADQLPTESRCHSIFSSILLCALQGKDDETLAPQSHPVFPIEEEDGPMVTARHGIATDVLCLRVLEGTRELENQRPRYEVHGDHFLIPSPTS